MNFSISIKAIFVDKTLQNKDLNTFTYNDVGYFIGGEQQDIPTTALTVPKV